jgi:hypothetical protein
VPEVSDGWVVGVVGYAPVTEPRNAFAEVAACLERRVDNSLDVYLGQSDRDELAEVLDEGIVPAKGGLITLGSLVSFQIGTYIPGQAHYLKAMDKTEQ